MSFVVTKNSANKTVTSRNNLNVGDVFVLARRDGTFGTQQNVHLGVDDKGRLYSYNLTLDKLDWTDNADKDVSVIGKAELHVDA